MNNKVMAQEQKEKAYDEALKYARYLINERCKEGTDGSFHRADLQKMFPELQESEDEKVRKSLIDLVINYGDRYGNKQNMLTWLEKQGEKLPVGFYYVNSEGRKFYSDKFKYGNVILSVKNNEGE